MKCIMLRVYVWSLGLDIWNKMRIDVEDLPYIEQDRIYYRYLKTHFGCIIFIDATEHLDSLPIPSEVRNALSKIDVEYPKEYDKLYEQFKEMCISNPGYNLERYLFS